MKLFKIALMCLVTGAAAVGSLDAQTISIVSGNGQLACVGCFIVTKTSYDPLVVIVRDASGRPLPNITVNWNVSSYTNSPGTLSANTSTTDSTGQTSVQFYGGGTPINLFNIPFNQSVVTASTGTSSVQFTETQALQNSQQPTIQQVIASFPTSTLITGQAGSVSTTPFVVTVLSVTGTPVPGVSVQLATTDAAGGPTVACQAGPGQQAGVILTDATGTANCQMVFGPILGYGATFYASVGGGYAVSPTQNLNVTVGPPALISVVRGDMQSAGAPGTNLPSPLVAKVSDLGGNGVGGGVVTWTVTPSSAATLFATGSTSGPDGTVSTSVKIGAVTGPFQVKVSLVTNPAIAATFTVNAPAVTLSGLNIQSGNAQTVQPGSAFAPLVVQALSSGAPVSGVAVGFQVTSGSATPASGAATTNAQGQASFSLTAGSTIGPVTVVASAGGQTTTFNLSVATGPAFSSSGFYNGASFAQGSISPCSMATIIAAGLAPGVQGVVTPAQVFGPLPYLIAGVSVNVGPNNRPAPLFSVANVNGVQSVTFQVPCDITPGPNDVTVTVGGAPQTVKAVPFLAAGPGIFETTMSDKAVRAALVRPDGSFVDVNNPARRGEIIRLYATGLGPVNALVTTNSLPAPGPDVTPNGSIIVGVNNAGVRVVSARLAPGLIGVFEVAFEVPADAATGNNIVLSVAVNLPDGSPTQYSKGSLIPIL